MNIAQFVGVSALTLAISACSTFPIRSEPTPKNDQTLCTQTIGTIGAERKRCAKHSIYELAVEKKSLNTSTQMYILEINDQGLIANPETAEAALAYLRQKMATQHKPLVSLFVHGWNNNAQADNEDLINFEQAVMALNASQQEPSQSDVVGIYVSWRGKTMPTGLSHALTFWGRKAVSEEVGRGQLANFIFELETVVKPKLQAADEENGKLILSGHSFGASALYNAVGHELMSRFYSSLQVQKDKPEQEIRGVGDIVILLNPAIQALRFNGLRETVYQKALEAQSQQKDIFVNNKAPVFMMVATEDDLPVETAFPLGRTVSHFLSHNAYDKMKVYQGIQGDKADTSIKQAERNSIGFYAPYYTHFLLLADQIDPKPESNLYRVVNATQQVLGAPKKLLESPESLLSTPQAIFNATKGVLETPQKLYKEVAYEVSHKEVEQPPLSIGACLSDKVKEEFQQGKRTEIDWLVESVGENENFSTVKKPAGSRDGVDLLKLKLTNNPKNLNTKIIEKWPLIQSYENEALSWARNPYWFVKAKSNVMQGHNGIWNKNVACLLLSVMATKPVTLNFMQQNNELETQAQQPKKDITDAELMAELPEQPASEAQVSTALLSAAEAKTEQVE